MPITLLYFIPRVQSGYRIWNPHGICSPLDGYIPYSAKHYGRRVLYFDLCTMNLAEKYEWSVYLNCTYTKLQKIISSHLWLGRGWVAKIFELLFGQITFIFFPLKAERFRQTPVSGWILMMRFWNQYLMSVLPMTSQ